MKNITLIVGIIILIALILLASIPSLLENIKGVMPGRVKEEKMQEDYVPGEIIVKFKEVNTLSAVSAQTMVEDILGFSAEKVENIFPASVKQDEIALEYGLDRIYLAKVDVNRNIPRLVKKLNKDVRVEYAGINSIVEWAWAPNDPGFHTNFPLYCQWALHNDDELCMAPSADPDVDIDAPEAWDITIGDSSIIIALLDSGVDLDHEDLVGNLLLGPDDLNGHGTKMAGIMAAVTNNGIGIAGVCPNCKILPEEINNEATAIAAIYHAKDQGAKVISMSFVLGTVGSGPYPSLQSAINYAHDNGIVLVAAAGNDWGEFKRYPCGSDNVLCVAATTFTDEREPSSNYGDWVNLSAPGYEVYTTVIGGGYNWVGQTSAATAQVAGEAGLILSKYPDLILDPSEVESIIVNNVEPVNSPGEYIGSGRINTWYALRSFCDTGYICPGEYECFPGDICKFPCINDQECIDRVDPSYTCESGYCEDPTAGIPGGTCDENNPPSYWDTYGSLGNSCIKCGYLCDEDKVCKIETQSCEFLNPDGPTGGSPIFSKTPTNVN